MQPISSTDLPATLGADGVPGTGLPVSAAGLIDALVAACVLIAQIDGAVTPDERGRMVERLRSQPLLEGLELETALRAFEAQAVDYLMKPVEESRFAKARHGTARSVIAGMVKGVMTCSHDVRRVTIDLDVLPDGAIEVMD